MHFHGSPWWCAFRASPKHTIIHTHRGQVAVISRSSGLRSWQQWTGTERPSTPNLPDWLDGGEAVRCWAISGSCPASFGRQRTWGSRLFWCVEGYRQHGPALAFREDIVSVQIRLVLHKEHLDWAISGYQVCFNWLCPNKKHQVWRLTEWVLVLYWLVWARKQNKSPSPRELRSTWAVLLFTLEFCHMCYLRRIRNIWICSGGGCNFRSFAPLLILHSVFILVRFSGEWPGLAVARLLNVTDWVPVEKTEIRPKIGDHGDGHQHRITMLFDIIQVGLKQFQRTIDSFTLQIQVLAWFLCS